MELLLKKFNKKIKTGSVVVVTTRDGSGPAFNVEVVSTSRNIKNGFPGISYTVVNDNTNRGWCYTDQIVEVISG